jgi:hypothetical protein
MQYLLHVQFISGCVDFEVSNLLDERPMDTVLSDYDDSEEELDEDDEDDRDAKRVAAYKAARAKIKRERLQLLPEYVEVGQWEYHEETEELGIVNMYDEVGLLARYLRTLNTALDESSSVLGSLRVDLTAAAARRDEHAAKQLAAQAAAAAAAAASPKSKSPNKKSYSSK